MHINDDADAGAVVREAVAALSECARAVGKATSSFDVEQLNRIEAAMRFLQSAVDLKRRMIDA